MKCKRSGLPIDKSSKIACNAPVKVPGGIICLTRQQESAFKLSFIKHMNLIYAHFKDYICDICDSCDWTLSE